MTDRTPACEDSGIGERMRELQRDRMAVIAGCICFTLGPAQRDVAGNLVHAPQCPLRQPQAAAMASPTQIEQVLAAVERMRARAARTRRADDAAAQARLLLPAPPCPAERYVEHIERAIAEKAARHLVLS